MKIHRALSMATLCLIFSMKIMAQTPIVYNYDATGNRILRQAMRSVQPNNNPQQQDEQMVIPMFAMSAYPNPTIGPFTIEIERLSSNDNCTATIYDIAGRQILSQPIYSISSCIDLSQYPAGYYILQITLNGDRQSMKIIKE